MNPTIIFRIIIFYLFIIIAYRLINKQELKELTIADGIIFILTIQLMIEVLFNDNQNFLIVIFPVLALIFFRPLLRLFDNKKSINNNIVIRNGKVNFSEIAKKKYSLHSLVNELSNQGIGKIEDIKMAYLNNDELVVEKQYQPLPLVINGVIDYQTLTDINKTPDWLLEILESKNLSLSNIYYSFYIDERLFIIQKDL
ncbi:MAG: DUF421 domain-containing protein [Bacilli bacterium]|nr:DUF421 domain-containing protein [Bacilli bacterium]MDD4282801.1 DUF421 domain-containing protein [Bacilli bacterium]